MITQQFDLNLIPNQAPVIVDVDQYDTGEGRFVISLYKDDVPYSPTSASAVIQGTKPDGHGFSYAAELSDNIVTANLTDQMTPVAGDVRAQIVVTESSGRTGSFDFILRVQKSALPDDSDLSESDYPLIEQALEAAATAVAAAESASDSEEAAAGSARAASISEQQASDADRRASASAQSAFGYMGAASRYAETASTGASDSEAYAVGTRGGTVVPSTDPAYHNNSEYYAGLAGTSASNALDSENAAKLSEQNAKASEDILSFYVNFVAPHFVIQNNRLYINDPSIGDFVVANNRLYFKLAS